MLYLKSTASGNNAAFFVCVLVELKIFQRIFQKLMKNV